MDENDILDEIYANKIFSFYSGVNSISFDSDPDLDTWMKPYLVETDFDICIAQGAIYLQQLGQE